MKRINYFLVLFFSVLIATAEAITPNAETLLSRDIMTSAKTLATDTNLYNYFYLEQVWPELETESGRISYIQRYLSARAGTFWDSNFNDASTKNYAAGPALYFAIDPLISKAYGNAFIEINVPKGTRFINVVSPISIKKDTLTALIAEGFTTAQDNSDLYLTKTGFYRDTLRVMVLPQYSKFRNLVHTVFTKNKIEYIEYNFNTNLMGFCTKHSYSAFAFVGTPNPADLKNAIISTNLTSVTLYSTDLNLPNLTSDELIQKVRVIKFRTLLEDIGLVLKQNKPVKKDFLLSRYTEIEIQAIKNSTFSCDK